MKTFEQIEGKLKKEYPGDAHAVYGTLNKIGLMRGSKVTAKGRRIKEGMKRKMK